MRSRRQMRRLAAWLGMLALLVQVFVPGLLAAEFRLAQEPRAQGIFAFCAFGHLHVTVTDDGSAPASPGHGDEAGALCPICLALLASPAFTAPLLSALPLPAAMPVEILAPSATQRPAAVLVTAYRSRAPPVV